MNEYVKEYMNYDYMNYDYRAMITCLQNVSGG